MVTGTLTAQNAAARNKPLTSFPQLARTPPTITVRRGFSILKTGDVETLVLAFFFFLFRGSSRLFLPSRCPATYQAQVFPGTRAGDIAGAEITLTL